MNDEHSAKRATSPVDLASFERLVRMETKLDHVIESKTAEHTAMAQDLADHETRLRNLERVVWKAVGVAAGVSAVVGTGVSAAVTRLLG